MYIDLVAASCLKTFISNPFSNAKRSLDSVPSEPPRSYLAAKRRTRPTPQPALQIESFRAMR
jgi:hypothetical protein